MNAIFVQTLSFISPQWGAHVADEARTNSSKSWPWVNESDCGYEACTLRVVGEVNPSKVENKPADETSADTTDS